MRLAICALSAVALFALPALAQQADIKKAVACQTLDQQFGDSVKTAKAEDSAKESATGLAKEGATACADKDYDGGMDKLRQALTDIGLNPIR